MACLLVAGACTEPPQRGAAFAGCPHWRLDEAQAICMRPEGQAIDLRVGLRGATRLVSARLDGEAVEAPARVVDGVLRLELTVPPGVSLVQVDVEPRGRWRMPVEPITTDPRVAAARAAAPSAPGPRGRALVAAAEGLDPAGRADLLLEAGHFLHVAGDFDGAAHALSTSESAASGAKLISRAAAAMSVHAYHAIERHRLGAARFALDQMRRWAVDPGRAAELNYLRGLAAYRGGDLRGAAAALGEAGAEAELWGDPRASTYREIEAEVLMALGRRSAALAIAERIRRELNAAPPSVTTAQRLNNNAWITLMGAMDRKLSADPRPTLEAAIGMYDDVGESADPCLRAAMRSNLALARLEMGDAAGARKTLDARRWPTCGPVQSAWVEIIDARLRLASDPKDALDRYRRIARRAAAAALPEVHWRALVGAGEAHEALGQVGEAIAAWTEAERLLDDRMPLVALAGDGERFLADRGRSARLLVDAHARHGRPAEALCAARRARRRQLATLARVSRVASLDEDARAKWDDAVGRYRRARSALEAETRDDWQRTPAELDALAAERSARQAEMARTLDAAVAALGGPTDVGDCALPPAGEALALWTPGRDGWLGFLATADAVSAARFPKLGDGAPAHGRALLETFGAALPTALDGARRLVVLATGEVNEIAIHALPWRGRPLMDTVPVVYGLDLPKRARAPRPTGAALVVGDPRSNLRAARAEAREVASTLQNAGWVVEHLQTTAALGEPVRQGLARSALMHYAGHGEVEPADQWAGRLPLADGTWLEVGDVLAAPSVPQQVVLSGCRTGLPAADTLSGGMSFAHAFLLAGSRAVVASTKDVRDEVAAAFSVAYHRGGGAPPGRSPEAAFVAAAQALRAAHPDAWADFRLWVP